MEQQASAPPEARAVADFLRNSSQIPLRNGLLNETRYSYFHGTRAVAVMLSPQYQKYASKNKPPLPIPKDEAEAEQILHGIVPFAFFLRVERGDRLGGVKKPDGGVTEKMRRLKIVQQQMFKKEMHYAWFYEGSQLRLQLMGFGMVAVLLAGVMFPLWPPFMRQGVWYLSIGLLGLVGAFFGLAIIRLILWAFSKVIGKPFWLFPNLFADVGVVESFIPLWDWDVPPPPPKKSKRARLLEQKQQALQEQRSHNHAAPAADDEDAALSPAAEAKSEKVAASAEAADANGDDSAAATPEKPAAAAKEELSPEALLKQRREQEKLSDLD